MGAVQEADMWRAKYEQEGLAKAEDLEMAKVKLQSRLSEAQGTIEQLNAKFGQLDKAKTKIQGDIDEMAAQADQAHILNSSMENKVLSNEIKDIMDQISEGVRSIHEIDKIRKRLEAEKMELQAALEEAEGAPEQEENKVLRASL